MSSIISLKLSRYFNFVNNKSSQKESSFDKARYSGRKRDGWMDGRR
jgi:hypothetical protein